MTDKTVKHERDEAVPEFMNDIVDDLEYIPRNERLGRAGRLKRKYNAKWLPTVASVALVLIVVLAMVFDNEEKSARETADSPETGLARIEERLEVLETKIAVLEKMTQPTSNTVKAISHGSSRGQSFRNCRQIRHHSGPTVQIESNDGR